MSDENEELARNNEGPADTARYFVTYTVQHHPDGLTREEVEAMGDVAACHDLLLGSMMHTADGGLSTLVLGKRHDGGDLTAIDEWKFWALLAHRLGQQFPDDDARGEVCRMVFGMLQRQIAAGSPKG